MTAYVVRGIGLVSYTHTLTQYAVRRGLQTGSVLYLADHQETKETKRNTPGINGHWPMQQVLLHDQRLSNLCRRVAAGANTTVEVQLTPY